MDYLELKQIVKSGKKKVFILYSEDEQLIIEVRDMLRKKVIKEDNSLSHIKLDGNRCTVEDLQNALLTYSMFQDEILLELSNANFMNTQEPSEFKNIIEAYLKDPREDLSFIAYYKYENELSKKNFYLERIHRHTLQVDLAYESVA